MYCYALKLIKLLYHIKFQFNFRIPTHNALTGIYISGTGYTYLK